MQADGLPITGWTISGSSSTDYFADLFGRALHEAKIVGGPWGPPCMRVKGDPYAEPKSNDDFEMVKYGYDSGLFECECPQQGRHLLELLEKEYASDMSALQAGRRKEAIGSSRTSDGSGRAEASL